MERSPTESTGSGDVPPVHKISPPLVIALVATLVFAAGYFGPTGSMYSFDKNFTATALNFTP